MDTSFSGTSVCLSVHPSMSLCVKHCVSTSQQPLSSYFRNCCFFFPKTVILNVCVWIKSPFWRPCVFCCATRQLWSVTDAVPVFRFLLLLLLSLQPVQQLRGPDEESAEDCSYLLPRLPPRALSPQQWQRHGLQRQQDGSQPGL